MSETTTVTDENKKTIIAFIVGLLVGGLLVYVFAMPVDKKEMKDRNNDTNTTADTNDSADDDEDKDDNSTGNGSTTKSSNNGSGSADVDDQSAGGKVALGDVKFPGDAGWIGVRDYEDGRLSGLLGVSRWNKAEGLMPKDITLLRPTVAGKTYAIVFYSDNGDKVFNLATDVQMEGSIATFEAK